MKITSNFIGLNVSKKLLKDRKAYLEDSIDAPKLLDIGTCILHVAYIVASEILTSSYVLYYTV